MSSKPDRLTIPDMPVYWRIRREGEPSYQGIPEHMGLSVEFDPAPGWLRQAVSPQIRAALQAIYRAESNIGYLQEGHTLAQGYGSDLIGYLEQKMVGRTWHSALEIGCGGCYVLSHLKALGKSVLGIDPSPIAATSGERLGIKVITDFFPPAAPVEPAGLILHSDVLEHVEDPVGFLAKHQRYLRDDGVLLIAVPDCTESIALGDLSMLMHQHVNYFSASSLRAVVEAAGFQVLDIAKAGYGGSLYCLAGKRAVAAASVAAADSDDASFIARARQTLQRMQGRIGQEGAGYYMPLRAIPYLSALGIAGPLRFFDDTAHWHYGYIDGAEVKIENFADLAVQPTRLVHVMSLTFGDVVAAKIRARLPEVQTTTLRELLAP